MNQSDNELDIQDFNIADSEIPAQVLEAGDFNKNKPKSKTQESKKSNFLITANPNISWRSLTDPQKKVSVAKKLIAFGKNLEVNLRNHKLLKDFATPGYKHPQVTDYRFSIETGGQNGFIHLHAIAMFDGYTQLRLPVLKEFLDRCMGSDSAGGYVNVQAFKDTKKTIDEYVAKHANALYDSQRVD